MTIKLKVCITRFFMDTFGLVELQTRFSSPSTEGSDYPCLQALIEPHVTSFNAIIDNSLLDNAVKNIEARSVRDSNGTLIKFWIEEVQIDKPALPEKETFSLDRCVYPAECRQRGVNYEAKLTAKLCFQMNNTQEISLTKHLGNIPVMVRSNRCHLETLSAAELVRRHEESEETGGYFIVNGIERLLRLLVVTRRNYALAIVRPSFVKKGPLYSQFGISIRCVRDDTSSQTMTLHYLTDGGITLRFSYMKNEYLVPVLLILRALKNTNDKEIFDGIVHSEEDTFLIGHVENLLREYRRYRLYSQRECLEYLGSKFQAVMRGDDELSEEDIGRVVLRKLVLVHFDAYDGQGKFAMLLFMMRKLYALIGERCAPDDPDSLMHHEILLPGHLYNSFLKEKLDDMLSSIRSTIALGGDADKRDLEKYVRKVLSRASMDVGKKVSYFLATGNMPTLSGLDLQQTTGYSIVAERLNFYRYISHFRSVHRGSFFATLKTTTVRKLLPEAWGFLCPVHTPDGAPCGLLNHLSHTCRIVVDPAETDDLGSILGSLGVFVIHGELVPPCSFVTVQIDGRIVGYADPVELPGMVSKIRQLKAIKILAAELEIALILPQEKGPYPGLFLFTTSSRMMRPVLHRDSGCMELVGTLEQVFLNISLSKTSEVSFSHYEIEPTHILSVVANMTPFSDFNQSPRNMYQCQMGKQSMGTPIHSFPHRTDNKMYRLHTGQSPIVRPKLQDQYGLDQYPNGANAVVAVISYTGYDMEDAMILCKSSFERGFGHGSIYKSELIDVAKDVEKRGEVGTWMLGCSDQMIIQGGQLNTDGLPPIGVKIKPRDPWFSVINRNTGEETVFRYKGMEEAFVDNIKLLGEDSGAGCARKAFVTLRVPRQPVIGDKFSSRHGQKGVCSQKWPLIDMPFTEQGVVPDIIINPHAFPSRMTIGMFVESIAGKAGALSGHSQDATPFQWTEGDAAHEHFGRQLRDAGFNFYGSEPMYSGVLGTEFHADIFVGLVFYQRLRHMVNDKFQVRTWGPVHNLTHQPIKGRSRAGGIRFGEMERDSLLAHGVSFLLQDRLMNCSDYCQMYVCADCGCVLPIISLSDRETETVSCLLCDSSNHISVVALPYVYRYLATELMAMNIRLRIDLTSNLFK